MRYPTACTSQASVLERMLVRLAREDGFTIIEVLAAAILVILTAVGAFTALDAAAGTADGNKSRNVAASLAQGDQERLRGINQSELVALAATPKPPRTETVDRETYTVESQAQWVVGAGGATTCTASDAGSRYLRISSTVRWPGMEPIKPVTSTSIKAVNNATASGQGDLAVSIMDRTGATGVAGLAVSISGPEAETQTTNANGCVFFDFIPAGSYTVTFQRTGWIESKLPNRQAISDTVVVASDQTATKSFQYDQAGGLQVRFRTRKPGTAADVDSAGAGFTISHSELGTPPTKTFTGAPASTLSTGLVLFPFTSAYTVWAGRCDAAKLPDGFVTPSQTATVPPGGTAQTVDVLVPTMKVAVVKGRNRDPVGGARVVVRPVNPACTAATSYAVDTPAAGVADAGVAYFALPYGDYVVCAQNTPINPTETVTAPEANKTRLGSTILVEPKRPPSGPVVPC